MYLINLLIAKLLWLGAFHLVVRVDFAHATCLIKCVYLCSMIEFHSAISKLAFKQIILQLKDEFSPLLLKAASIHTAFPFPVRLNNRSILVLNIIIFYFILN